jgi:2-polyprenyl-3-methyl-5-hydroxy-6-metoxy-1,4-benzoquinol methylase
VIQPAEKAMKLPKLKYVFEQEWLVQHCVGKSVLHLGCAGDATLRGGRETSLHVKIYEVAKRVCGVELNEPALMIMKDFLPEDDKNKYFIGDVQCLGQVLGGTEEFDIILAGSIIEHVSNAGLMIGGGAKYLDKDGLFIISTPHTWGLLQFLRVAMKATEAVHPEHTCWYSIPTLTQLMSRYGFRPVEWATGYGWRSETLSWKAQKLVGIPFFKMFPHLGGSLLASFKRNA